MRLSFFCLPLAPCSPFPRPDSPPLLDKVGLIEEHGAPPPPFPKCGDGSGEEVSRFVPPSSHSLYMSKRGGRPALRDGAARSTSADFSSGHTPRAFLNLTPLLRTSAAFLNIQMYCRLVIESHCFCGCGGERGLALFDQMDGTCPGESEREREREREGRRMRRGGRGGAHWLA